MDQDLSLLVYLCYKYVGKLILYKKIKIKIKTNLFLGQLNICMNLNRLLVLLIFVLKITYLSPIVNQFSIGSKKTYWLSPCLLDINGT